MEEIGPLEAGFRWVQVGGTRVYSIYYSPNVTLAEYNLILYKLEDSIRRTNVPVLAAGDFNAKWPEWGAPTSDPRGDALAETMSSLDLHVCNVGGRPKFIRGAAETHIDVTFASRLLWLRATNWRVLDEESLSLHQYITFDVEILIGSVL